MLVRSSFHMLSLAVLLTMTCDGARANAKLEPAGLAAYTETSRDIYLAALLIPAGANLENVFLAPGPKAMEYRIATRRISSRGFSGTLLLQAEMGSGSRTPEQVIKAIDALKTNFRGNLRRGDRFVIAVSEDEVTSFYLNDTELASIKDGTVFDFFFSGWVGESSSALLRDSLLAGTLNPAIKARYDALEPNAERVAETASWVIPQPEITIQQVAYVPVTETNTSNATGRQAEAAALPKRKPAAERPAPGPLPEPAASKPEQPATGKNKQVASAEVTDGKSRSSASQVMEEKSKDTKKAKVIAANSRAKPASARETVPPPALKQPSATSPAETAPLQLAVANIPDPLEIHQDSDAEYQRKLTLYITDIMKMVFGEVNYPRRAVEKQREGKVEVVARLDENGQLIDVSLDTSSGFAILDEAAQKAVRKAAPFPELPPEARNEFVAEDGESYVVMIPVTFKLQN